MNLRIGSEKLKLEDADLLGCGGEARVYRWRDRAVKVYHADAARKLAKIAHFPTGLPPEVVAPLELVSDGRGKPVGFTMRRVDGAEDFLRLAQRSQRLLDNAAVTRLFGRLHEVVGKLHQRGVVIGDFNDGNVLHSGVEPWLIDADSMQFAGFACEVGHERFLDPRLYGVDLAARPAFSAESDWYAFSVLLFASLLYVHPYGGLHKTLPTLLRRAEARHSILRDDVQVPRAAVHWRILPDELLQHFSRVFDGDQRPALPPALLALRWSRCRCGLEHARVVCPACASMGIIAARAALRVSGGCTARTVVRTHGRILAAAVRGGIQYLVEEDGVIRRENGSLVLDQPRQPGMRFLIAGDSTWVGLGNQLRRVADGRVVERAFTATINWLGGRPAFAASPAGLHRVDGDWLMENDLRVGPVLGGQTFVAAGERLGVGFYRAGQVTQWFLFRRGKPGLVQLDLPPLDGKLVDLDCVFDEEHALLSLATEQQGRRTHRLELVDATGRRRAHAAGAPDSARFLASVRGKALDGGRIACLTDEGVLSLAVDAASGLIGEGRLFTDTAPFCAADAQLLRGPGGSLFVVSTDEIVQMTLSGGK